MVMYDAGYIQKQVPGFVGAESVSHAYELLESSLGSELCSGALGRRVSAAVFSALD